MVISIEKIFKFQVTKQGFSISSCTSDDTYVFEISRTIRQRVSLKLTHQKVNNGKINLDSLHVTLDPFDYIFDNRNLKFWCHVRNKFNLKSNQTFCFQTLKKGIHLHS